MPNEHPRWPLYRATLVCLEEDLLTAAGLPPPAGEPVSVLYSPGVGVRMGAPGGIGSPGSYPASGDYAAANRVFPGRDPAGNEKRDPDLETRAR
jgi:hypothetical protein